jgi:hypothetical protein
MADQGTGPSLCSIILVLNGGPACLLVARKYGVPFFGWTLRSGYELICRRTLHLFGMVIWYFFPLSESLLGEFELEEEEHS